MDEDEDPPTSQSGALQRSPPSLGSSPSHKKTKGAPAPVLTARSALKWIRHTLYLATTRKTAMAVETQRNLFGNFEELDTAVTDLVIENLQLQSQLEEARRSAEICIGAAASQFGTEFRLREAAHEQTLEDVVARYAEKEAVRSIEAGRSTGAVTTTQQLPTEPRAENAAPTFATVARRRTNRKENRQADRSRSRATARNKTLKENRQVVHMPAFVMNVGQDKTASEVRNLIWTQAKAKKVQPRCQTITTKAGKTILKPEDKETHDMLKHLSKVSSLVKEDSLRWPRVIIRGVGSDMEFSVHTQGEILAQNPELGIDESIEDTVLKPIFKSGPRDRSTINWIVEVHPKYYGKFEDTTLYLGFMRCRASIYEEVTQCHICLRHSHPSAKCLEKECVCAHCSRKGHKSPEFPALEGYPKWVNCRGKHSARDKSCSARTAYLLSQVMRTDYGISK